MEKNSSITEKNGSKTEKQKALAIMKWTMKKYFPFSIAYWILLALTFPMVELFIMMVSNQSGMKDYIRDMAESVKYMAGSAFAGVAIVYSIIIAIMAFSYMHNKRSVDFYGSMPVSRRTLFFARYITVLILTIVPFVIIGLVGGVLSLSLGGFLKTVKVVVIASFNLIGNISFLAFISVCCGTVADVLVSYAIINVVYPICVLICMIFPQRVIPGMSSESFDNTLYTLFCPIAAMFTSVFGSGFILHMVWWTILIIAMVVGCGILIKKRKAETAQNAFAFSVVEIVIKFVSCFTAGFGFGWVLSYMTPSGKNLFGEFLWFVIGFIVAVMIVNVLLHLIFNRGLSKYRRSLPECGAVMVVGILFMLSVSSGGLGYDTRVPETEDVKEVSVSAGERGRFTINGVDILKKHYTDKNKINSAVELHNQIIQKVIKAKTGGMYSITGRNDYTLYEDDGEDEDKDSLYDTIKIEYKLKNGKTIKRKYTGMLAAVNVPKEFSYELNSDYSEITAIPAKYADEFGIDKFEPDYNEENQEDADDYEDDYRDVYYHVSRGEKNFKQKDIEYIIDSIKKDIKLHGNKKQDDDSNSIYNIDICYTSDMYKESGYYTSDEINVSIGITKEFTNTLAALAETGYSNVMLKRELSIPKIKKADIVSTDKDETTVYFRMPDSWNKNLEVRCCLSDNNINYYMYKADNDDTICEKVSDDIYKYSFKKVKIYDSDMEEYLDISNVRFYQYSADEFNYTKFVDVKPNCILEKVDTYKNGEINKNSNEYKWTENK